MFDFFQNLIVTTGIGFGLIALGLYVERRWIGLPKKR